MTLLHVIFSYFIFGALTYLVVCFVDYYTPFKDKGVAALKPLCILWPLVLALLLLYFVRNGLDLLAKAIIGGISKLGIKPLEKKIETRIDNYRKIIEESVSAGLTIPPKDEGTEI